LPDTTRLAEDFMLNFTHSISRRPVLLNSGDDVFQDISIGPLIDDFALIYMKLIEA
jgi:hypothetical protein